MDNKLLLVLFFLSIALGCTRNEITESREDELTRSSHVIPLNTALETLNQFLQADDTGVKSVNGSVRTPSTVSTVLASHLSVMTKGQSALDTLDCEELLYIVNFQDNNGYAILAADDRISERLLMVADSGSLDSDEYYEYFSSVRLPYRTKSSGEGLIIYDGDGYPCINPDAITLYDDEVGDSYVGDYTGQGHNSGTGGAPFILIDDFINNEIGGGGHNGGFPVEDPEETIVQTVIGTTVTTPVSPLLTNLSSWHQGSPFNDYFPNLHNNRADAGCVPLAISRIIAYFEYPSVVTYNGVQVDWTALKTNITSSTGQASAAALLRRVAVECASICFCEGTFTFPLFAKWFLQSASYSNVVYTGYDDQRVLSALLNDCPVFICSVPYLGGISFDFGKSHGWNIDGYKQYVTTTQIDHYIYGIYSYTTYSNSTHTMVHCDFGWGGAHNGYFTSGIFNLTSQNYHTQFDNPTDLGFAVNYNAYLKTITYSHP